jgi:DNA repair protein RadA/Sms
MPKARTIWRCAQCGHTEPKWAGRCAECGEYGTFTEEASAGTRRASSAHVRPVSLGEVETGASRRVATNIGELDRVLGGGLVKGSLVLLGGEPGIGKSTLLLQLADAVASRGTRVLYVCGEESPSQVRMRADRLGCTSAIDVLPVSDISAVESVALSEGYDLVVVDSIQTMTDPEAAGGPGSVSQVRECTARLVRLAKDHGVTTMIVGHVTKDGSIAGPRVLEHMVDTVVYFEGDRDHAFRVVRAVKNRFGSVSEIGVFEMGESGLAPVANPSAALLAHRPTGVSGSAVMAAMEGSRPLMVEIQALVSPSFLQMPRRLATGIDPQRLLQVLAVLERRAGLSFGQHDVYVSVAGGVRIVEPAADLPLALALASARSDVVLPEGTASFGELGLAGEVRPAPNAHARIAEAAGLGLSEVLAAPGTVAPPGTGIKVAVVAGVADAVAGLRGHSRAQRS